MSTVTQLSDGKWQIVGRPEVYPTETAAVDAIYGRISSTEKVFKILSKHTHNPIFDMPWEHGDEGLDEVMAEFTSLLDAARANALDEGQVRITAMAVKGYVRHLEGCKRRLFEGDCTCGLHEILSTPGEPRGQ